jgi:RNA polymerase sigma-70 factor (family 1)
LANSSILTDEALFSLIGSGDENAFSQLYQRHWETCFMTAFRILGKEDLAEDIVQELFIKLWEKRTELSVTAPLAYLRKASRNLALNSLRHLRTDDQFYVRLANITAHLLEENPHFLRENEELFRKVINSLPEDCREAFSLSRIQQLSYKEIASQLQISEKTVEKRISRALQHIRQNFFQYMLMVWTSREIL